MQWTRHIDHTHPNGQGVSLLDVVLIYNECYGLTNWASSVVLYAFILQRKCPKRWRLTRGLNISLLELTFKEKKIKDLFVNGISDWATILEFFENFLFQFTTFFRNCKFNFIVRQIAATPPPPLCANLLKKYFCKENFNFSRNANHSKIPFQLVTASKQKCKTYFCKKKSSKSCCKSYWSINHSRSKALARSAAQCAHFFTILIPIQCDQKKIAKLSIKVAQKLLH